MIENDSFTKDVASPGAVDGSSHSDQIVTTTSDHSEATKTNGVGPGQELGSGVHEKAGAVVHQRFVDPFHAEGRLLASLSRTSTSIKPSSKKSGMKQNSLESFDGDVKVAESRRARPRRPSLVGSVKWQAFPPERKIRSRREDTSSALEGLAFEQSMVRSLQQQHTTTKIAVKDREQESAVVLKQLRKTRHDDALSRYRQHKKDIFSELEGKVSEFSDMYKATMKQSDSRIAKETERLADEFLVAMEFQDFEGLWQTLSVELEGRANAVQHLSVQFEGIEVTRRSRVENELEQLVSVLVDAAFELPDEIERRLEPEVRAINDVMIENRMAFTDLQARMKVSEIKLKDQLHRQWEGRREAWRRLRHRRAIDIVKTEFQDMQWLNPSDRRAVLDALISEQKRIYEGAMAQLSVLKQLKPPSICQPHVHRVAEQLAMLRKLSDEMCDRCILGLADCGKMARVRAEERIGLLRSELRDYAAKTDEEIEADIEQEVIVIVKELERSGIELVDKVSRVLEMEEYHIHRKCEAVVKFYTSAAELWERFLRAVDTLENSNTEAFLSRQDEYTDAIEALEQTLNQSVQELRQAPNTSVLDASFNKVKSLVGDKGTIKQTHLSFNKESMQIASSHLPSLETLLQNFEREICSFIGLKPRCETSDEEMERVLASELGSDSSRNASATPKQERAESGDSEAATDVVDVGATAVAAGTCADRAHIVRGKMESTYIVARSCEDVVDEILNAVKPPTNEVEDPVAPRENEESDAAASSAPEVETTLSSETEQLFQEEESEPPYDPENKRCAEIFTLDMNVLTCAFEELRQAFVDGYEAALHEEKERVTINFKERQASLAIELDEQLRIFRPRLTRIEVDVFEVRAVALEENLSRFHRHWHRIDSLLKTNDALVHSLCELIEQERVSNEANVRRLTENLPKATSLSALQSLHAREKKLSMAFAQFYSSKRVEIEKLHEDTQQQARQLQQQFVQSCVCLEDGGSYHRDEMEMYAGEVEILGRDVDKRNQERDVRISSLFATIEAFQQRTDFVDRFHHAQSDLSMRLGIGRKFGSPMRKAAARLHEEANRAHSRLQQCDDMLMQLEALKQYETGASCNAAATTDASVPESETLSCRAVQLLVELRRILIERGTVFDMSRRSLSITDIELLPDFYRFLPDCDSTTSEPNATTTEVRVQKDEVEQTYADLIEEVDKTCRDEMKELCSQYFEEHAERLTKPTDDADSLPAAIHEFLETERASASELLNKFKQRYRLLVVRLVNVVEWLPKVVIADVLRRSLDEHNGNIDGLYEQFKSQLEDWQKSHRFNKFSLKPSLRNPRAKPQLDIVCEKERAVHEAAGVGILKFREDLHRSLQHGASKLLIRLVHASVALVKLFDSILTLDDIDLGGEDNTLALIGAKKRRGLKRLVRKSRRDATKDASDPAESKTKSVSAGTKTVSDSKRLFEGLDCLQFMSTLPDSNALPKALTEAASAKIDCSRSETNRITMIARKNAFEMACSTLNAQLLNATRHCDNVEKEEQEWWEHWQNLVNELVRTVE